MLERESSKIRSVTMAAAYELKDEIENELKRSENILRGIEGLFHSSEKVSRSEYQTFCQNALEEGMPLHLVEWQPKVHTSERKIYEEQARLEGLKDFHIFEIDGNGNEVPAKDREYHFPVFYSYSPSPENQAVGLDLAFSPLRMESKYKSMKIGKPVTSATFEVILKNSTERSSGFAITYPVFLDPNISSSDSLKHLRGFIAIVLYLNDFFIPLTNEKNLKSFQFEVRDLMDKEKLIYSTLNKMNAVRKFSQKISIDVGNRVWELIVYPTGKLVKSETSSLPWIVWTLIVLLSVLFSAYLYLKGRDQVKIGEYERQIQQKQRLESLGTLASGIAHEFNNNLQCITLAIENLHLSKLEEADKEFVETSLEYCKRGRGLVRQILSFARQDSGSFEGILPSVEIKNTLQLIGSSLGKKINLDTSIDEENDREMWMNVNHLSQILINLCNNAAHSMDGEGTIRISYKVFDDERVITVEDHGHGMEEEIVQKIFDPFFTTKPVNEGTGLGLSVIYGIVKSYNGEIEVASMPGKGSVFRVTFPS